MPIRRRRDSAYPLAIALFSKRKSRPKGRPFNRLFVRFNSPDVAGMPEFRSGPARDFHWAEARPPEPRAADAGRPGARPDGWPRRRGRSCG